MSEPHSGALPQKSVTSSTSSTFSATPRPTPPTHVPDPLKLPHALFTSPPTLTLHPFPSIPSADPTAIPITVSFALTSTLAVPGSQDDERDTDTLSTSTGHPRRFPNDPSPPLSKRNRKAFSISSDSFTSNTDTHDASFTFFIQQAEKMFASLTHIDPFTTTHCGAAAVQPRAHEHSVTLEMGAGRRGAPFPILNESTGLNVDFADTPVDGLPTPQLSPLPKFQAPSHRLPKCHSSNTFVAEDRACQGSLSTVIQIVSIYLHDRLMQSQAILEPPLSPAILDDHAYPIMKSPLNERDVPPTCEAVFRFLYRLFESAKLCSEISVFMLIYMDRFLFNTKIKLTSNNWIRILVGALLLACKVWDDDTVWNSDFCTVFSKADVKDMNDLERFYLQALYFNIHIDLRYYTRFYLKLHDNALRIPQFSFPLLKPFTSKKPFPKDLQLKSGQETTASPKSVIEHPRPEPAPAYLPGVTPAPLPIFLTSVRRISSEPNMISNAVFLKQKSTLMPS